MSDACQTIFSDFLDWVEEGREHCDGTNKKVLLLFGFSLKIHNHSLKSLLIINSQISFNYMPS